MHHIMLVACSCQAQSSLAKDTEVLSLVPDQMLIPVTVRQRVSAMESSRTRSAQYALRSLPLRASCRSISANTRSTIRWVRRPSVGIRIYNKTANTGVGRECSLSVNSTFIWRLLTNIINLLSVSASSSCSPYCICSAESHYYYGLLCSSTAEVQIKVSGLRPPWG